MKSFITLLALSMLVLGYTVTVVGPSGNFTAKLHDGKLEIGNKTVDVPKGVTSISNITSIWNNTYTVYLVHYVDPNCQIIREPNKPGFWIGCPKGTEIVVVAVKDPQARVVCRDNLKREVKPEGGESYAIYRVNALSVECESELSPVVTMPTQIVAVLAGVHAALLGATAVLAILMLKRAFK